MPLSVVYIWKALTLPMPSGEHRIRVICATLLPKNTWRYWTGAGYRPVEHCSRTSGALEFGDILHRRGILPSIAHTDAIYEDVVEAVKHGFTHITHFYSCMNGVTRRNAFRYAGCVEAGYLLDEITIELITDGVHVPAPLMKLAVKNKGAEKIALVTDSMRGAGMPEGKSILGSRAKGREVLIEDGVAKMPDRQSFAGSVATADRLVRNMYRMGERPLEEAVRMMTLTPPK